MPNEIDTTDDQSRYKLTDHVSVVLMNPQTCENVQFLLSNDKDGYWLPNAALLEQEKSWEYAAVRIVKEWTGICLTCPMDILLIHRIRVPDVERTFSHVFFGCRLPDHLVLKCPLLSTLSCATETSAAFSTTPGVPDPIEKTDFHSMAEHPSLQWVTVSDIASRGLEIRCAFLLPILNEISISKPSRCRLQENSITKWIKSVSEENLKSKTRQLMQAAKFGEQEVCQIYKEFLIRSYPFVCLTKRQFGEFMIDFGWPAESVPALYHSFEMKRRNCLNFKSFIQGLAAMEPTTEHGGIPAEVRCRYIFRYYDANQDNKLSFQEFRAMVSDIWRGKGQILNTEDLQKESERCAMVFGSESRSMLTLNDFLTAVGQLKFRGTSMLLRSPVSILKYLCHRKQESSLVKSASLSSGKASGLASSVQNPVLIPKSIEAPFALPTGAETFELAAHSVKVAKDGVIINVSSLWDFEGTDAINGTLELPSLSSCERLHSFECFNDHFLPNDVISALRYFERALSEESRSYSLEFSSGSTDAMSTPLKDEFSWGRDIQKAALAPKILALCRQVEGIVSQEPRLISISSPVYVLGDLHGNYEDLMRFENTFWRLGVLLSPASLLFLGDYVDRGAHGLEVVAYLFAQKVIAPQKVVLLRGNHEIRILQKTFTFYKECISAFGADIGTELWEGINRVFDNMPLAAVIDNKVLCVHGGIYPSCFGGGKLSAILDIPCPLKEPDRESPLAWEIMWNDPVNLDSVWPPEAASQIRQNDGFGYNARRGTAHIFSEEALAMFLQRNHLTHLIRAHEVQQSGFQIQPNGKCLTVFSSSKYCGASNEAACILCANSKLRIIRLGI